MIPVRDSNPVGRRLRRTNRFATVLASLFAAPVVQERHADPALKAARRRPPWRRGGRRLARLRGRIDECLRQNMLWMSTAGPDPSPRSLSISAFPGTPWTVGRAAMGPGGHAIWSMNRPGRESCRRESRGSRHDLEDQIASGLDRRCPAPRPRPSRRTDAPTAGSALIAPRSPQARRNGCPATGTGEGRHGSKEMLVPPIPETSGCRSAHTIEEALNSARATTVPDSRLPTLIRRSTARSISGMFLKDVARNRVEWQHRRC